MLLSPQTGMRNTPLEPKLTCGPGFPRMPGKPGGPRMPCQIQTSKSVPEWVNTEL